MLDYQQLAGSEEASKEDSDRITQPPNKRIHATEEPSQDPTVSNKRHSHGEDLEEGQQQICHRQVLDHHYYYPVQFDGMVLGCCYEDYGVTDKRGQYDEGVVDYPGYSFTVLVYSFEGEVAGVVHLQ